jgi:hypothetical protein
LFARTALQSVPVNVRPFRRNPHEAHGCPALGTSWSLDQLWNRDWSNGYHRRSPEKVSIGEIKGRDFDRAMTVF